MSMTRKSSFDQSVGVTPKRIWPGENMDCLVMGRSCRWLVVTGLVPRGRFWDGGALQQLGREAPGHSLCARFQARDAGRRRPGAVAGRVGSGRVRAGGLPEQALHVRGRVGGEGHVLRASAKGQGPVTRQLVPDADVPELDDVARNGPQLLVSEDLPAQL